MRVALIIVGAVLLMLGLGPFALSLYTSNKIERMQKVRGEIPGATFVTGRIEHKWTSRDSDGDVYYINVRYAVRGGFRTERDNVDAAFWATLREGGPIRVALLPDDDEMYLPDGIWASAGNLELDRGMLIGERVLGGVVMLLGGALIGIGGLMFLRRRT